jgi:hypothetical protein
VAARIGPHRHRGAIVEGETVGAEPQLEGAGEGRVIGGHRLDRQLPRGGDGARLDRIDRIVSARRPGSPGGHPGDEGVDVRLWEPAIGGHLEAIGVVHRPDEEAFEGGLARFDRRAGVAPASGDAVLIRTGWLENQTGKPAQTVDFNEEPGIDVEAALWLAEAGVALVGADNYAIEAMPFPAGTTFPVHQRLIRDFGIPLLEGLVLQEFAALGVPEFLFVAAPLPIVGGTGSPITPLAIY